MPNDLRTGRRIAVSAVLDWGREALSPSPTPTLDAQVLLAHTLGKSRAWVLAHGADVIGHEEHQAYASLIDRRVRGEPVAYLRGYVEWFGMEMEITPGVLIPRAETELVVERAIELARKEQAHLVADIGTGSGAMAIAMARNLITARVFAVDSSQVALGVAAKNVQKHGVAERVTLVNGSLLTPLGEKPDLIVANLPYVSAELMRTLERSVRYEPPDAMFGGADGLELYADLFDQMAERGWAPHVVCEIDPRQSAGMRAIAHRVFPNARVDVYADYAGRDRIAQVRQPTSGVMND
jgi:release factor glutamine methyltransferase